jgi:hypothetical protein
VSAARKHLNNYIPINSMWHLVGFELFNSDIKSIESSKDNLKAFRDIQETLRVVFCNTGYGV